MRQAVFILILVASSLANADDQVKVIGTTNLPECVQGIQPEIYPRWKVKNTCGFPIEILWCWKTVPPAWINAQNTCAKTGFLSSSLIEIDSEFEFPQRPYLDNKFKPTAMLTVKKVCKVSRAGDCK